jgi:hypothetical protein
MYPPATKSRGHINLPPVRPFVRPSVRSSVRPFVRPSIRSSVRPFVRPNIDTWFVRLSPPTVLELQL